MAKTKMIAKLHYHYEKADSGRNVTITMDIDLSRFERQYGQAQYLLDSQIMTDMIPFMPMVTHTFINVTRGMSAAIAGSGHVFAAAPPFGRFLYEGNGMVDPVTGSPYARPGSKKVLVSQYSGKTAAKERLEYSKNAHPNAQSHWFEASKRENGSRWVKQTKRIAGGGNRG